MKRDDGGGQAFWLPYWHIKSDMRKYGQWAPTIAEPEFRDLLAQARKAGYLDERRVERGRN